MSRSLLCMYLRGPLNEPAELPRIDQRNLSKWADRWTMADGRKVWVRAMFDYPRMPEIVDAREWVESMHDEERWPMGTVFEIVVGEVPEAKA